MFFGAHCAFEIALSWAIMLTLLLFCAFSPRKYKSILRGIYNAVSVQSSIIRNVPKAHIVPQAHRFCRQAKTSHHRFYKVSLPGDASHTALLKSHCRGRQCSLFCLCAPFPHASTKVSCVGFMKRIPFREIATAPQSGASQ